MSRDPLLIGRQQIGRGELVGRVESSWDVYINSINRLSIFDLTKQLTLEKEVFIPYLH